MKNFSVEYLPKATRALDKLDERTRSILDGWIKNNLDGCENPRLHGKALQGPLLQGPLRGKWSYRVGDYRIVAEIQDDKILILIVDVAHRSKVYR